jgi:hypothetical protein
VRRSNQERDLKYTTKEEAQEYTEEPLYPTKMAPFNQERDYKSSSNEVARQNP